MFLKKKGQSKERLTFILFTKKKMSEVNRIKSNCSVDEVDENHPYFYHAYRLLMTDDDELFKVLVNSVTFDIKLQTKLNVLHMACINGDDDLVERIIRVYKIENPNIVHFKTGNYFTPLYLAAAYGNVGICKILLENGAKISINEQTCSISCRTTALFVACRGHGIKNGKTIHDYVQICKMLLENGADVNTRDSAGFLCIHDACVAGHLLIVELLLQTCPHIDINLINNEFGTGMYGHLKQFSTPLHWAARLGHFEIVKKLVEFGADPMALDNEDRIPYDFVKNASSENMKNIELFLRPLSRI